MSKTTRYFEFTDDSSNKFWKIDIQIDEDEDEYGFVVTYGKIGSNGQTSEKSFDSAEECQKEADKLIAQKTKKGYVEKAATEATYYANDYRHHNNYNHNNDDNDDNDDDDYDGDDRFYDSILNDPNLPNITKLTILCQGYAYNHLNLFTKNPEAFANVDTLVIGDTDGDYNGLFKAMPQLKSLTIIVRDCSDDVDGLELGKIEHENLRHLGIGIISASILHDLSQSKFPNLETLILYPSENLDFSNCDIKIEDIIPLLSKKLFPKLRKLGIVDSEMQDEIDSAVKQSDIGSQLEMLSDGEIYKLFEELDINLDICTE